MGSFFRDVFCVFFQSPLTPSLPCRVQITNSTLPIFSTWKEKKCAADFFGVDPKKVRPFFTPPKSQKSVQKLVRCASKSPGMAIPGRQSRTSDEKSQCFSDLVAAACLMGGALAGSAAMSWTTGVKSSLAVMPKRSGGRLTLRVVFPRRSFNYSNKLSRLIPLNEKKTFNIPYIILLEFREHFPRKELNVEEPNECVTFLTTCNH